MQRERDSNGRFRSPALPPAPYERARGPDGRFIAQTALQVADHTACVAGQAGSAGIPTTTLYISWLKPMAGILAACTLPTTLASNVSGAMATAGTINGTTSANGTLNSSFLSTIAATAHRLPTSGLDPDAALVAPPKITAVGHANASFPFMSLTGLQCPHVPGLFIELCGGGVPAMAVRQFVNLAKGCMDSLQSGDNCEVCFCAMVHTNRALQYLVFALDKILKYSTYADATIGAQMLRARPLIDFVTDTNPLGEINGLEGWQEAMARIIAIRDHVGSYDLLSVAAQLICSYPDLLVQLGIGVSRFGVVWFLKWWIWGNANDGRVDVNLGANVEEVQELEEEEELLINNTLNNTPSISAEDTPFTLIDQRNIGRTRTLQYRFHIENQPYAADRWAGISFLTELFGLEEVL